MVFTRPNPVSHIQKIYELSPRYWRNTKENIPLLIRQFEEQLNANIFRPYRHKIQSLVLKNLLEDNSDTGDSIDKSLNEECDEYLFFACSVLQQIAKHHISVFHVDVSFKRHKIES